MTQLNKLQGGGSKRVHRKGRLPRGRVAVRVTIESCSPKLFGRDSSRAADPRLNLLVSVK